MLVTPIFSALAALAAVVALVLLAARLARRAGLALPRPSGALRRLSVQDTLALDRARRLHLVRCDGRDLLIVTGGQTDLVVGWIPGPAAPIVGASA